MPRKVLNLMSYLSPDERRINAKRKANESAENATRKSACFTSASRERKRSCTCATRALADDSEQARSPYSLSVRRCHRRCLRPVRKFQHFETRKCEKSAKLARKNTSTFDWKKRIVVDAEESASGGVGGHGDDEKHVDSVVLANRSLKQPE